VRILHISDAYFPRVNGVSTSIQTFINAFRHQGHEVDLIAPDYGVSTDDETGIIRVPGRSVVVDPEDRMMHAQAILRLTARLRAAAYDLIHIHTPFIAHYLGLELAKRLKVRCVETYHTYFEHYLANYVPVVPGDWLRGIARQFSRWQCNSVDAVVVPSRAMSRVLRRYGVSKPMSVVPTGIDLA
jgi:glycosyltransferase involved in cell wall biosynthesis